MRPAKLRFAIAPATPQNKRPQPPHRHSGIFRVADLGPGTMPRGKYPESPKRQRAPTPLFPERRPGRHAPCQSRQQLPRPPPRNFQPPLPQPPSNLSKRKSAPQNKPPLAAAPPQGGVPSTPERVKQSPSETKNPSCRHSVVACVSESRGQDFAPATALRTNDNSPPQNQKNKKRINPRRQKYPESRRQAGLPFHRAASGVKFFHTLCHSDCTRRFRFFLQGRAVLRLF